MRKKDYATGLMLERVHHIAIVCSDYQASRNFYTQVLGLHVLGEVYRAERGSFKLNLGLANGGQIELFSFPDPPPRASFPEACGLRHLAFAVTNLEASREWLELQQVKAEEIRVDPETGLRYMFFFDPDGLPLELYEEPRGPGLSLPDP
ncbi:SMU1112c/YaeR family gloxylase I-like metalloprotein [Comamonas composti]|uniref:SMU1112c/YaeR family gloxylase I-like metalloprotein n=1 Tax=Comamonas composti TaxID=408558 RepID=UPI000429087F|nr:VOC family protein [Comamonas composti]